MFADLNANGTGKEESFVVSQERTIFLCHLRSRGKSGKSFGLSRDHCLSGSSATGRNARVQGSETEFHFI